MRHRLLNMHASSNHDSKESFTMGRKRHIFCKQLQTVVKRMIPFGSALLALPLEGSTVTPDLKITLYQIVSILLQALSTMR